VDHNCRPSAFARVVFDIDRVPYNLTRSRPVRVPARGTKCKGTVARSSHSPFHTPSPNPPPSPHLPAEPLPPLPQVQVPVPPEPLTPSSPPPQPLRCRNHGCLRCRSFVLERHRHCRRLLHLCPLSNHLSSCRPHHSALSPSPPLPPQTFFSYDKLIKSTHTGHCHDTRAQRCKNPYPSSLAPDRHPQ
jgi:hypothetical protein